MKIKGTCGNCGREVLPEQIFEAGGHCPWCGREFNKDYTSMLIQSLAQAESAGGAFQEALEQIAEIDDLNLDLDEEAILEPLREALRSMRKRRSRV